MKFLKTIAALVAVTLLQAGAMVANANAKLSTDKLTCEYIVNPLGIEVKKPRLSWTLSSSLRNQSQSAYEIIVSDNAKDIKRATGNVWQTGKVSSSQSVHISYQGAALKPFTRYYWRVKVYDADGASSGWSETQWFETAILEASDWQGDWIGDGSTQFENDADFYQNDPMPLLRKTFNANKKITSARLYISGLGYYEAFINGKKVGDRVLDPGWTSYSKQVLYSTYDITTHLQKGMNAAGVMLGNGWYNPLPLRFWGGINMRNALVSGRPCVKAMIRVQYTDGTSSIIPTDETWQTAAGPIIRNSIFLGEHHDARAERAGWNTVSAATADWQKAVVVTGPNGVLSPQMQPPVRVIDILKPRSVNEVKPGVFVFDMGQNFAGVARIRVQGPAGTEVKLRYGEDIYADGSLNGMTAVAGQIKGGNGGPGAPHIAWQLDSYVLKGKGVEEWSPKFTFHGFRYVEVTGWPGKPELKDIDGLRMSADLQEHGTFTSSNEMFNKLDTNIKYTFLSNAFSVQSDCPGREKLGYGGDLFCTTESYMYHYDMAGFYRKIVKDFTDDQQPLGGITETVPFVGIADSGPGDKSGPLGFQVGFPYLVKKIYDFMAISA
jgi:alpha-L-rhamnosidase